VVVREAGPEFSPLMTQPSQSPSRSSARGAEVTDRVGSEKALAPDFLPRSSAGKTLGNQAGRADSSTAGPSNLVTSTKGGGSGPISLVHDGAGQSQFLRRDTARRTGTRPSRRPVPGHPNAQASVEEHPRIRRWLPEHRVRRCLPRLRAGHHLLARRGVIHETTASGTQPPALRKPRRSRRPDRA